MTQSSPNLKPKSMHTHSDKATRLGVPRANVLDLRTGAETDTDQTLHTELDQSKRQTKKSVGWWQRRKMAKQELLLSEQRKKPVAVFTGIPEAVSVTTEKVQGNVSDDMIAEEPETDTTPLELVTDEIPNSNDESPIFEEVPELIAAPVPEEAKIHQSALHEPVEYDTRAEERAQHKAEIRAEREAYYQAKREAKQQRLEAKRQAKAEALEAREALLAERRSAQPHMVRGFMKQATRSIAVFTLMLSILVSPFAALGFYKHVSTIRDAVVEVSEEAVANLAEGGQSATNLDFTSAQESFSSATTNFTDAHNQLLSVSSVMTPLVRVIPEAGDQFTSAENVLKAGENISAAGEDVAKAFAILSDLHIASDINNSDGAKTSLTDGLVVAHSALRPALPRLELASLALSEVDVNSVPENYRDDIALAQEVIPQVEASVRQLLELSETMLVILGHEESKRYLVLFQNNAEIRPTGGFIGSFAVVDINQGRVSNIEIPYGGSYDLLYNNTYKVVSPTPLHFVNPHWQMHDANWWPHTPSSFQLVQKMYRKQGGTSVDGVISLTPEIIEHMLEITGPIPMPEYNGTLSLENTIGYKDEAGDETVVEEESVTEDVIITADNFYRYTQEQAERKFDDTNQSKKFIADLTPKLLEKLFTLDAKSMLPVLQLFSTSLDEKDILLYFNDAFLQDEVSKRGWTGEVESTPNDYLQVVDTNIAGGKTNRVISKVIKHHADIQTDGSIVVTTEVTYTHNGKSGDELEGLKNLNYVRFYVPEGSQLISAEGFTQPNPKLKLDPEPEYEYSEDLLAISGDILIDEATQMRINNEFGKTVFGNFVETAAGETSTVKVQYTLPFIFDVDALLNPADAYSLLIQKQPGDFDPLVLSSVTFPSEYSVRWSYPETTPHETADELKHEIHLINTELKRDVFVGLVLEQ